MDVDVKESSRSSRYKVYEELGNINSSGERDAVI